MGHPEVYVLSDGLSSLCVEMRKVLGTTAIGDMPRYALESSPEERIENCIISALKLYRLTSSTAAKTLIRGASALADRLELRLQDKLGDLTFR